MISVIRCIRIMCAIEIQRMWKGIKVRKLRESHLSSHIILKWRWARQGSDVRVASDISGWEPWVMTWCSDSEEHRIYIPGRLFMGREEISFKFVVNGEWMCDGSALLRADEHGNVNNYICFPKHPSDTHPVNTPKVTRSDTPNIRLEYVGQSSHSDSATWHTKLRKQLTASDRPNQDHFMIRRVNKPLPRPKSESIKQF
jgi:hypothetical protein